MEPEAKLAKHEQPVAAPLRKRPHIPSHTSLPESNLEEDEISHDQDSSDESDVEGPAADSGKYGKVLDPKTGKAT